MGRRSPRTTLKTFDPLPPSFSGLPSSQQGRLGAAGDAGQGSAHAAVTKAAKRRPRPRSRRDPSRARSPARPRERPTRDARSSPSRASSVISTSRTSDAAERACARDSASRAADAASNSIRLKVDHITARTSPAFALAPPSRVSWRSLGQRLLLCAQRPSWRDRWTEPRRDSGCSRCGRVGALGRKHNVSREISQFDPTAPHIVPRGRLQIARSCGLRRDCGEPTF